MLHHGNLCKLISLQCIASLPNAKVTEDDGRGRGLSAGSQDIPESSSYSHLAQGLMHICLSCNLHCGVVCDAHSCCLALPEIATADSRGRHVNAGVEGIQ